MASLAKLLPENVPGEFFVDSTCIDCDTCRQLAPADPGHCSRSEPRCRSRRRLLEELLHRAEQQHAVLLEGADGAAG